MPVSMTDRNMQIYRKAVLEDLSTSVIGREFGISGPRVSQIVHGIGEALHGQKLSLEELRKREKGAAAETAT